MNLHTLELYICKLEKSKYKKEKYTAFPHFWSADWGSYNDDGKAYVNFENSYLIFVSKVVLVSFWEYIAPNWLTVYPHIQVPGIVLTLTHILIYRSQT